MLGLRTAGYSLGSGELGDGKDHHAGKELHSSHIVTIKGVRGGGEHFEDSQRLLELAQRSSKDRAHTKPAAAPRVNQGIVLASLQSTTSPRRRHWAEMPESVCKRTPRSGAVRPARARQMISFPLRNAMAAPVARVNICARSVITPIAGSRLICGKWLPWDGCASAGNVRAW